MRANQFKQTNPYVVVIPYWIYEALYRSKLTVEDCLDYAKLKTVVSADDLAGFYNAQSLLGVLVAGQDNMLFNNELYGLWERGIPQDNPELLAEMTELTGKLSQVLGNPLTTISRIFGDDTKVDRYDEPFKVVDLANKVFGLVVYPGHFNEAGDQNLQGNLVSALLKAFNMYNSYDELAATPLFNRFLKLLSGGYVCQ